VILQQLCWEKASFQDGGLLQFAQKHPSNGQYAHLPRSCWTSKAKRPLQRPADRLETSSHGFPLSAAVTQKTEREVRTYPRRAWPRCHILNGIEEHEVTMQSTADCASSLSRCASFPKTMRICQSGRCAWSSPASASNTLEVFLFWPSLFPWRSGVGFATRYCRPRRRGMTIFLLLAGKRWKA
jgi:hypothetical protein